MKYKKSLQRIAYFCLAYTGIMFVMLFLLFYFPNAQRTKDTLDKNSANIASRVAFTDVQYEAIYNETVNNEYLRNYINNDSKFDKTKLQTFLSSYSDSAAPSIFLISVIKSDDLNRNFSVVSSKSTMTYDFFASSLELERSKLTEIMEHLYSIGNGATPDMFISGDTITLASCDKSNFKVPIYFFVSFYINDMVRDANSEGFNTAFAADDSIIYASDARLADIAKSLKNGEKSKLYYVYSKTVSISDLIPQITVICFKNRFYGTGDFLIPIAVALLISLAVLLIGLFIANRFTKRLYTPIYDLLKKVGSTAQNTDDEFETIGNFVDEMNKENLLMQNYIEESEKVLENQLLTMMLLGNTDHSELENLLEKHEDFHEIHNICATILYYVEYDTLYSSLSEMRFASLKSAITNLLYETFADYEYFKVINITPQTHVLIHSEGSNDAVFRTQLEECLKTIEKQLSANLSAYMGRYVDDFYDLHKSYSEALFVSKYNFSSVPYAPIYTIEDIQKNQPERFFYAIETESELISAVQSLNSANVRKYVDMLINSNFFAEFTNEHFVLLVTMLYSTISRILSEINADPKEVFGPDTIIYLELRNSVSLDALKEKVYELLDIIMQYIYDTDSSDYNRVKEKIEKFIDENYQHDVSLSDLSKYLNLSETYVSKLFKTTIGKNFKEYIMYYKYRKAKQIMKENPTYKLKDVAKMVGCNTVLTLSRLLKKYDS
ncbi:MAG: hypothetical protein K5768_07790 [Firmicutes bacterium]|nr:hypothetical protein [Bacillota bacterium]